MTLGASGCGAGRVAGRKASPRGVAVSGPVGGEPVVASTSDCSQSESEDVGARLDALFARRWKEAGVVVAPPVNDEAFLRRASLDLMGRVPSVEELGAYAAAPAETRRRDAVRRMLASEDFVVYWGRRHVELLLGGDEIRPRFQRELQAWAEDALRRGDGWDDMVNALLTAEGSTFDTPAGAFIVGLERQGQDAAVAARVSEAILGVQLECAQCHDHPYVDLSREDFWGMAAYFARTRVRPDRSTRPAAFLVADTERGETRIASMDGGPRDLKIGPSFLGEAESSLAVRHIDYVAGDRRTALASRVLASPLTAKAAVGRVWTDLFGAGISGPWNDLGGPGAIHDPALDLLADAFVAHDWDLRWLLETLVIGEVYGRSAIGDEAGRRDAEASFARARIRPLSAEQLYASLMTASGLDGHSGRGFRLATGQRRRATLREVQTVFPAPGAQSGLDGEVTVAQMLWLLNGSMTQAAPSPAAEPELGAMVQALADGEAPSAAVRALYRRLYAREPHGDELAAGTALIVAASSQRERAAAIEDLAFAMLVSTEFVTNH